MTAKKSDGTEIGKYEKHYHTQATTCRDEKMAYGAQNKASYLRDTSIPPYGSRNETFEIPLPDGVRTADITVELNYEINTPDNKIQIHKVTKTVTLDR